MSRMDFEHGHRVSHRCAAVGLTARRRSRMTEVGVAEQPVEPPGAREDVRDRLPDDLPDDLPPDVRAQLVRLIADELGVAWDAAIAAGADPARLAETIDERRKTIEAARDDTDS